MNYIIGDIQGCFHGLKALLKKIHFNPQHDVLWAVGDLVARGEDSLATLALLYDLGDSFKGILGNHDLHLLSVINGVKKPNPKDKLSNLLSSRRLTEFEPWLRQFPLTRVLNDNILLCHAGLYPQWSFSDALNYSREIQMHLKGDQYVNFLANMYVKTPLNWQHSKTSDDRHPFIINAFTRMRYIKADKSLDFTHKCTPEDAPKSLKPWFTMKNTTLHKNQRIMFGHWASLFGKTHHKQIIGLDTGYVWGGQLTCFCLETNTFVWVQAY